MSASPPPQGHALRLIEFAHALGAGPLPGPITAQAKRCLLDNLACGLFGASQPWARMMRSEVIEECSRGPCSVFGHDGSLAAPAAALANGTAIHGFELDDLIPSAVVHPGTVIVPAVLAASEAADASGARMLAGIVAGYEACARISRALGTEVSERGFHKTGVVGPVAAAIAAGTVLQSSVARFQNAIGLACSMSSGIKAFAAGSGGGMVKRMHAGRAAEAGVRAVSLAGRGFTGPASALDGRLGLLDVFGGASAQPERLSEGLGEDWFVEEVWVKVYPICGWIQGVVQALLAMRGQEPFPEAQVKKVVVGTSAFAVEHNGNRSPRDEMEAQYSIPYCAGLALTADPARPDAFGPDAIANPVMRKLAERVELRVDPEADAVYPDHFASRVELRLANGEVKEAFTLDPRGTAAYPLSDDELTGKFRRLVRLSPHPVDAEAIIEQVGRLESATSVRMLTRLLRG